MKLSITTIKGVKPVNEDVIGHLCSVVCLCDGHWGDQAAKLACKSILNNFPTSKVQAVQLLESIQEALFQLRTNENPPETSVAAINMDIYARVITILGYGDCRLLIVRNKKIVFSLKTRPTWLGALSHLQIRKRLSPRKGIIFKKMQLQAGDRVMMFTDGVDECVYEKPTIPHQWIATHSQKEIFERILKHGAEDNASLIIFRC